MSTNEAPPKRRNWPNSPSRATAPNAPSPLTKAQRAVSAEALVFLDIVSRLGAEWVMAESGKWGIHCGHSTRGLYPWQMIPTSQAALLYAWSRVGVIIFPAFRDPHRSEHLFALMLRQGDRVVFQGFLHSCPGSLGGLDQPNAHGQHSQKRRQHDHHAQ